MSATAPSYDGLINPEYLPLTRKTGEAHALRQDEHIRVLPGFLLPHAVELFHAEARRLLAEHGARKDKIVGGTPRNLVTVNGTDLLNGTLIPGLLMDPNLHQFSSGVAGTRLTTFGNRNEALAMMALMKKKDRHGEHCDAFRGVFNIALAVPGKDDTGGLLTFNDPSAIDGAAQVQIHLEPGDAYFMDRTDRIKHEVTALTSDLSQRIIISIALTEPHRVDEPSQSAEHLFNGKESAA